MTNVLIIEDEVSAQKHLEKLLGHASESYEVLDRLTTVVDAIEWLTINPQPALIFMDIHLSDGISFDILEEVDVDCPIVFVTAYDEYAIKAFKTTGIDYLLKPITQEDLNKSLDKFNNLMRPYSDESLLKAIEAISQRKNQTYKKSFLLKSGNHMLPVKSEEIAYFYRADLVFAKTFTDTSYVVDFSLNQLQELLDHNHFFRLNRRLLVNLEAIKRLTPTKPGQLRIEVEPDFHEEIHLSQERSAALRQRLDSL